MRMESYQPRPRKGRWGIVLVILILAAGGIWFLSRREDSVKSTESDDSSTMNQDGQTTNTTSGNKTSPASQEPSLSPQQADQPAPGPKGMTRGLAEYIGPSPITVTRVSREQAVADLREGLNLFAQNTNLLPARTLLNRAYISGQLAEPQAIQARKALEDLADRTVLRRESLVNPEDPYLRSYTFRSGDMLHSRRKGGRVTRPGVIARNRLNVPAGVIVWVNGLRSAAEFRAGVSYKLLQGPFHMVVYKSRRVADIFLRDLFVRRIPICIGAAETPTPEGYFRIVNGGKTVNSPYYPPAETGRANVAIFPGQAGYPLGPDGRNMKIEGIATLGTNILASQSYAIHGTNDPTSIGQAESRGCLRLRNEDMEFVYGAFQDYAAPDDPSATWDRWSTITIQP
ncbi:MAG: L,D-transpeptidase family protein [Phycisphaerae bacterium]|nr:L,D-transpeptidase family protein [Phycisphaerae bacterium]